MLPILLSLALLGSGVSEDNMEVSQSAIKILKELEQLRLEAYKDGSSISIGYGHSNSSGGEQFEIGDTITEEKAEELLIKDLEEIQRIVNQRLENYDISFNQNQFDVMVIGTYNRPGKLSSKKFYEALLLDNEDEIEKIWNTSITDKDREDFPGLVERLNIELSALDPDRGIPTPVGNNDPFGILDWYKGKTIEEMRSDLVSLAKGDYFDDDKEYAFMAGGGLVVRSGEELNDQAPEGPGPEEFMQMDDEDIVSSYIFNIKMYPEYADIKDKEGFAKAFLPALDNMNNVAQYFRTGKGTRENPIGSEVQLNGNGMEIASEIGTGAITDYIATGFKNKEEFYEWYLSDVANLQVVMQPGQTQAEDFSIVGEGFYNTTTPSDKIPPPNTRFPRKPEENVTMNIEPRSAGITNMYGAPPQDTMAQKPMSERKQKINNVFTKLFSELRGIQ